MNTTQHGFRTGRSTISQLLRYHDSILSNIEEGHKVDAIYLDFAKAFDKVDHKILLKKAPKPERRWKNAQVVKRISHKQNAMR